MDRRLDGGAARGARQAPRSPPLSCQERAGGPGAPRGAGLEALPGGAALPGSPQSAQRPFPVPAALCSSSSCVLLRSRSIIAARGAARRGRLRPGRKMRNWSAAPARRGAPSPPAPRAGAAVPPLRPPPGGGSPQGAAPGLRARARGGPGRGQRGANPPVPVPRCSVRGGSSGRAPRQPRPPLATTRQALPFLAQR